MLTDIYDKVLIAPTLAVLFISSFATADVVQWFNTGMEDEWWDAVGEVTTIDFVLNEEQQFLSDQYADIGVTFSSDGIVHTFETGLFLNDGWGMRGLQGAWVHFDTPMHWIGADHPGTLAFALFSDGHLIYESFELGGSGLGHFSGLISEKPFDSVYLFRHPPDTNEVYIDDLHFGAIPAPGALAVFGLGLALLRSHRRRS